MKDYNPGNWGVGFIFSCEGSVFPKALACAFPNALLAVGLWYLIREVLDKETFEDALSGVTVTQSWNAYNWVIGFLVSFRAQRAYSRWWEGGTLLQQARGEWFNAYSSLIAFCTRDESKFEHVRKFQKIVARLTSMLYASALMSIATENDLDFEILDASGLSEPHLEYLRTQADKCEIIMQWIQRLIVDNMHNGVLSIPPPVLSRVFQELSRGIVNIHNVRKITEFQFPFPAAQMIVSMLILQWFLTPIMAALVMTTPVWAFFVAFFPIFACWGINYIATEIEQPFGTDYNDMPLHFMQCALNTSITSLLDGLAQTAPDFDEKLERESQVIQQEEKVNKAKQFNFPPMRSVRHVTIQDPDQLNKVKRRFISRNSFRTSQQSKKHSWSSTLRGPIQRPSNLQSVQGPSFVSPVPGDGKTSQHSQHCQKLFPPKGPGHLIRPHSLHTSNCVSVPEFAPGRTVVSSVDRTASQNSAMERDCSSKSPKNVFQITPPPPDHDTRVVPTPTDGPRITEPFFLSRVFVLTF